ncbi:hypothetical protein LY76DRAFT_384558 [Colletotrichum caudatum]|nr:hypothetical protein LY76DRAFT_384558 [Colletotrichum caudatum]
MTYAPSPSDCLPSLLISSPLRPGRRRPSLPLDCALTRQISQQIFPGRQRRAVTEHARHVVGLPHTIWRAKTVPTTVCSETSTNSVCGRCRGAVPVLVLLLIFIDSPREQHACCEEKKKVRQSDAEDNFTGKLGDPVHGLEEVVSRHRLFRKDRVCFALLSCGASGTR